MIDFIGINASNGLGFQSDQGKSQIQLESHLERGWEEPKENIKKAQNDQFKRERRNHIDVRGQDQDPHKNSVIDQKDENSLEKVLIVFLWENHITHQLAFLGAEGGTEHESDHLVGVELRHRGFLGDLTQDLRALENNVSVGAVEIKFFRRCFELTFVDWNTLKISMNVIDNKNSK